MPGWDSAEESVNWWEMTSTMSLSIYWYEIYPNSSHILSLLPVFTISINIKGKDCPSVPFQVIFEQLLHPKCSRSPLLGLLSMSYVLTTWQMLLHTTLLVSHISLVKGSR